MAASLKDKRTPITTPPYQVPSVDVAPDPPIFSLVTTFKVPADMFALKQINLNIWRWKYLKATFLHMKTYIFLGCFSLPTSTLISHLQKLLLGACNTKDRAISLYLWGDSSVVQPCISNSVVFSKYVSCHFSDQPAYSNLIKLSKRIQFYLKNNTCTIQYNNPLLYCIACLWWHTWTSTTGDLSQLS